MKKNKLIITKNQEIQNKLTIKINSILLEGEELGYKFNINDEECSSLIRKFSKYNFKSFLTKPNLSLRNAKIRHFLINLFNFNFWQNSDAKYPRSQTLIKLIDGVFINDSKYDDVFIYCDIRLLEKLKYFIISNDGTGKEGEFKCWRLYKKNIEEFIKLIEDKDSFIKFNKFIDSDFNTLKKVYNIMKNLLPNIFGLDKFHKRENMFLFGVYQEMDKRGLYFKSVNYIFPIDYRIPSALYFNNTFSITQGSKTTLLEENVSNGAVLQKDDFFELYFRACAYKTLIHLTSKYKVCNFKFDEFLFWEAKNRNLIHLKVETTDY